MSYNVGFNNISIPYNNMYAGNNNYNTQNGTAQAGYPPIPPPMNPGWGQGQSDSYNMNPGWGQEQYGSTGMNSGWGQDQYGSNGINPGGPMSPANPMDPNAQEYQQIHSDFSAAGIDLKTVGQQVKSQDDQAIDTTLGNDIGQCSSTAQQSQLTSDLTGLEQMQQQRLTGAPPNPQDAQNFQQINADFQSAGIDLTGTIQQQKSLDPQEKDAILTTDISKVSDPTTQTQLSSDLSNLETLQQSQASNTNGGVYQDPNSQYGGYGNQYGGGYGNGYQSNNNPFGGYGTTGSSNPVATLTQAFGSLQQDMNGIIQLLQTQGLGGGATNTTAYN